MSSQPLANEPAVDTRAESPASRSFWEELRRGHSFTGGPTAQKEFDRESWLTYYSTCLQYVSSLHNQFIAVLSIQGAFAIGCLATIHSLSDVPGSRLPKMALGVLGLLMELALTFIARQLVKQHCITCWILAQIERESLGLPEWASMKSKLGTEENRLFTSPITFAVTTIYGLVLGVGLAFIGLSLRL